MTGLEALQDLSKLVSIYGSMVFGYGGIKQYNIIEKELKAFEIIKKGSDFSLEFDESQNEWFLEIFNESNEELRVLVAKGTGIETYNLLKEVLL